MELQYTKQFQKLMTESEQKEQKLKEKESNSNAFISQNKYHLDELYERITVMTKEKRKLEVS